MTLGPMDPTCCERQTAWSCFSPKVPNGSTASHAALRYVAMRTGGAYFNLRETNADRVLQSIGAQVFSFIGVEATGARPESLYPKLQVPVHDAFDLAGKLSCPILVPHVPQHATHLPSVYASGRCF